MDPICMRAKYEKGQIGKDKDEEKVVGYVSVREKVILEGKIDKTQTGKDEEQAEGHDHTVVNSVFAKSHDPRKVPEKKARPALKWGAHVICVIIINHEINSQSFQKKTINLALLVGGR